MKKIITILALWLAVGASAEPIDRHAAARIASGFVRVDTTSSLRSLSVASATGEAPAYYVFNDASRAGYVIVSGDDALPAVVGYSDRGQIDMNNLPIQLRALLGLYTQHVEAVRASGAAPLRAAQSPLSYANDVVAPLVKTEWNQSAPYNDLSPKVDGEDRAVTGCVATAMAQLMYFHQWPLKGKGSKIYTPDHKGYGELFVDFTDSNYAWSDMRETYKTDVLGNKTWTDAQGTAVAKLMYDAGVSVEMDFTPDESGAFTEDAETALNENFDYFTYRVARRDMLGSEFYQAIIRELDAKRPLMLTGVGSGGGHAWVIDGYDENGYLHTNWGWGGRGDGYFLLDFMSPSTLGIGGGTGGFTGEQEFIFITPRKSKVQNPYPTTTAMRVGIYEAFSPDKEKAEKSSFIVSMSKVYNAGAATYGGLIGAAVYAEGGDTPLTTTTATTVRRLDGLMPGFYYSTPFRVSLDLSQLNAGTYILRPVYRPTGETSWTTMANPMEITVRLEGDSVTVLQRRDVFALALTKAPEEVTSSWEKIAGSTRLHLRNVSDRMLAGDLGIAFSSVKHGTIDSVYYSIPEVYPAADAERLVVYNNTATKELLPGEYTVSFFFRTNTSSSATKPVYKYYPVSNPHGVYKINVRATEGATPLVYEGLGLYEGSKLIATSRLSKADFSGKTISVATTVRNSGSSDFSGKLRYRLVDVADGKEIIIGETPALTIRQNQTNARLASRVAIDLSTLELKDGHYYRMHIDYLVGEERVDIWRATLERIHFLYTEASTTSALDVTPAVAVRAFPNPTTDRITVEGTSLERIEVISTSGATVLREAVSGASAHTMSLGTLPAGVYFVRVHQPTGIEVVRIEKR